MDHYTGHCYLFYGFCFLFFLGVYLGTLLGHFIMIFYLPLVSPQRGNPTRTSVHGGSYTVKALGFHTNYNKRPSLLTMSPLLRSYYFNNFFRTKITRKSQCQFPIGPMPASIKRYSSRKSLKKQIPTIYLFNGFDSPD